MVLVVGRAQPLAVDVRVDLRRREIGVAQHQCLNRRIGNQATLERELKAWSQKRNAAHCGTDWQFTTQDARIKLKRLYPSTLMT